MHKRSKKVRFMRALVRFDPALTLKLDVTIGLNLSRMNQPISSGGVVLQTELRTMPFERGWPQTNDPQPDTLLGLLIRFGMSFRFAAHL